MTLSLSIQRAAAWVRAAVSGGELPSYQRSREELGGVPWRRFDQTDRWFLTSAHDLNAASIDLPLDEEVSTPLALDLGDSAVIPLVPPAAPPVPVIASAPPPVPVAAPVAVPVAAPIAVPVAAAIAVPVAAPIAVPVAAPIAVPVAAPVPVSWDLPAPPVSLPSGAFDLRPSLITPGRLAVVAALVLGLVGLGVAMRAAPPAPIAAPVAAAPAPAPAPAPARGIEVAQLDRTFAAAPAEHRLAHRKPHKARRGHR